MGLAFSALLSTPPSFSGDGQRASVQVSPNLVIQSKSARLMLTIAEKSGGGLGSAEVACFGGPLGVKNVFRTFFV